MHCLFGSNYALVIGNNNHEHLPDLKTAQTDARAVSNTDWTVTAIFDSQEASALHRAIRMWIGKPGGLFSTFDKSSYVNQAANGAYPSRPGARRSD